MGRCKKEGQFWERFGGDADGGGGGGGGGVSR